MIHVRSETEKKNYDQTPPANVLESDSLVKLDTNRHGTGTVDPVILAPTHADDLRSDAMEMLPLVSCVMSHLDRKSVV